MRNEPQIVASVLNAELGALSDTCLELEMAGLDAIQWDVMDGHFVPNLTLGPAVVAACRGSVGLTFEAHLMISEPERYVAEYVDAGCDLVIVHAEACLHLHRTLEAIKLAGARPGVALNPATPASAIAHVLDLCDLVLVMTVDPGFGGQAYLTSMEPKIAQVRELIDAAGRSIALEVDGGIGPTTIERAEAAGADRFVIGSALFRDGSPTDAVRAARYLLGLGTEELGV